MSDSYDRRRLQYSLRGLLTLVFVLAVAFALAGWALRERAAREAAEAKLRQLRAETGWVEVALLDDPSPVVATRRSDLPLTVAPELTGALVATVYRVERPARTAQPAAADLSRFRNRGALRFCAEPAAMPHSAKGQDGRGEGISVDLAKLVAKRLGLKAEFVWCSHRCAEERLGRGDCDAILTAPVRVAPPSDSSSPDPRPLTPDPSLHTIPYCGSYFTLAVPKEDTTTRGLDDLGGGHFVGIVRGSLPLASDGFEVMRYPSTAAVLDSVRPGRLHAGLVDAAQAGWVLHGNPDLPVRIVDGFASEERWNLAFDLAPDRELYTAIHRVLEELRGSREIKEIFARYGVRYQEPFEVDDGLKSVASTPPPLGKGGMGGTWPRVQRQRFFTVSLDPDNLPYSKRDGGLPGFEVELAHAIAEKLGLKAKIDWINVLHETNLGKLLDGECDLAVGLPVDPRLHEEEDRAAEKILYTTAYCSTGYLIFVRKDGPRIASLKELKGEETRRVGTEAGSLADYALKQRGFQRKLFGTQLAVLKALSAGKVDYAYLWSNAAWLARQHPELGVELVQPYELEDRRDIAAAVRRDDEEFQRHLNEAIGQLRQEGVIERLLSKYSLPCYPPREETSGVRGQGSDGGAGVEDRRLQRGKSGAVSEAERLLPSTLRLPPSAAPDPLRQGVLRVGMDYNNPPLSYMKPEPGGLDYEVAKLLAEELGVGLEVYWGRTSHDSYRSRMTGKKLFDVAMGVMRDSRFEDRVLYTRPYYRGAYVVAGIPRPVDGFGLGGFVRVGAEGGSVVKLSKAVAGYIEVRRDYGSQLAVLRAVDRGAVALGRVASTKAGWLLRQHPELNVRLITEAPPEPLWDVCLAVRKSDAALKAKLEEALERLEAAGKLEPIFEKYAVPQLLVTEAAGGSQDAGRK